MKNDGSDFFSGPQLLILRREIEERGLITDEFLPNDPDCPVFGINLACAHPFPSSAGPAYDKMASALAKLDEAAYVYPLWETHITMITFINFSRHKRPSPAQTTELRSLTDPIIETIQDVIDSEKIGPFRIELHPPVLTSKAAIMPVANPSGEISRIRTQARQLLAENQELSKALALAGLTVPGIIHSTIMRFKRSPTNLADFTTGFDTIAAATPPLAITVRELLLTAETKPYMRGGEIVRRFNLGD